MPSRDPGQVKQGAQHVAGTKVHAGVANGPDRTGRTVALRLEEKAGQGYWSDPSSEVKENLLGFLRKGTT